MYSRLLLRQFKHTLRRSPCSRAYHQYLTYSPKVKEALANNEPVVALESTIISHGMPYPMNVETARAVEKIVENGGCVPATVALMDGKIHVGLTDEVLERLGKHGSSVVKASRRDLAMVLSQGLMGATTVSTTMMAAHRADIRIFVTGGIGGVHRGAETTYDISADLTELGRTPITVVCAGAKSILDLPKTLEFLETQGVPVVTFGDSDDFPAFFTPKSGLKSPWCLDCPNKVAKLIKTNLDLDTKNGIVVAVPIPEESAADSKGINKAIKVAIQESMEKGIVGKEGTPFLLKRVMEITGGSSLKANIDLIKNNARVGSSIARSLAGLYRGSSSQRSYCTTARPHRQTTSAVNTTRPVLIIGGCALDVTSRIGEYAGIVRSKPLTASSFPGKVTMSVGGVAQNIARAAHLLGAHTLFASAVGDDSHGSLVVNDLKRVGLNTAHLQTLPGSRTAVYNAIHDNLGDLIAAVADMDINHQISIPQVKELIKANNPKLVGFDANISMDLMRELITTCVVNNIPILFEPTSVPKSLELLKSINDVIKSGTFGSSHKLVDYITPNTYELAAMANFAAEHCLAPKGVPSPAVVDRHIATNPDLDPQIVANALTLSYVSSALIIKLGAKGSVVVSPIHGDLVEVEMRHILPITVESVVNSNGAGDSLVGGILAGLAGLKGFDGPGKPFVTSTQLEGIVARAQRAAVASLQSQQSVSDEICPEMLLA